MSVPEETPLDAFAAEQSLDEMTRLNNELINLHRELAREQAASKRAHGRMLEMAHKAGMAEVATDVLHNIGNAMNSVSVSAYTLLALARDSKAAAVSSVAKLLAAHAGDLAAFFTDDPQGKALPDFLAQLGRRLERERTDLLEEVASLEVGIERIMTIISMQREFAEVVIEVEKIPARDLVEEALGRHTEALALEQIAVVRDYGAVAPVATDRHKSLRVITELIANAIQAMRPLTTPRQLTVGLSARNGAAVLITVADNGIGIPAEHLNRLFEHGFGTFPRGNGFGMHTAALTAQQLRGSLHVLSEGVDRGAIFTLELPTRFAAPGPSGQTGRRASSSPT